MCIVQSTPCGPRTSLKTHLPGRATGLTLAGNSKVPSWLEMPASSKLLLFFLLIRPGTVLYLPLGKHFLCFLARTKLKPLFFHFASWTVNPKLTQSVCVICGISRPSQNFCQLLPTEASWGPGLGLSGRACGSLGSMPQKVCTGAGHPSADH